MAKNNFIKAQSDESIPSTTVNFDLITARFRESPLEFKNYMMGKPKPSLTKTETSEKIEKLWNEFYVEAARK